jgi:hypothetical protein
MLTSINRFKKKKKKSVNHIDSDAMLVHQAVKLVPNLKVG